MPVNLAKERQQQPVALCLEAQGGKTYTGSTQNNWKTLAAVFPVTDGNHYD